MSTHTPGPWHYEPSEEGGFGIYDAANEPVVWEMGGIAEGADARLIATAPELLTACEAALDALNELLGAEYEITDELVLCRAAIAKARGVPL